MLRVQDKTCKFFLPLSVITQVINVLNGIWRHHLLSNNVRQKSCPLILDNNHSKFSVICVRFMYKYFFPFFNRTPFVFFKDISCYPLYNTCRLPVRNITLQPIFTPQMHLMVFVKTIYKCAACHHTGYTQLKTSSTNVLVNFFPWCPYILGNRETS